MEYHLEALGNLCRFCGEKVKEDRVTTDTLLAAKEINAIWDISIWKDDRDRHPTHICHKCFRKVRHFRSGSRTYNKNADFQSPSWEKHSRTGPCDTCNLYKDLRLGSRGNKNKFKQAPRTTQGSIKMTQSLLPFDLNCTDIFNHFHSVFSVRQPPNNKLAIQDSTPLHQQEFFNCPLCLCILSNPVHSDCQHSFCSDCLTRLFQFHHNSSVPCPICQEIISFPSIKRCPNLLSIQLENLLVMCTSCHMSGPLSTLRCHT